MDDLIDGSCSSSSHSNGLYWNGDANDTSAKYTPTPMYPNHNHLNYSHYSSPFHHTSAPHQPDFMATSFETKCTDKTDTTDTDSTDTFRQAPVETKETERNNLLIWDWDDTLFPTYAFRTHADKKDEQFMSKLKIMVDIIHEIFTKMIATYGAKHIIIVTNGSENWIHKCLNVDIVQPTFMKLQVLLTKHKIPMISASRMAIRRKYPTNPYKWKEIVFADYFAHFFGNDRIPCITSIGDSLCEYKASDISSKRFKDRILNRVLFKSNPSISEMIFELRQILMMTSYFGVTRDDIDLDFSSLNPSFVSSSEDTPAM
eukprot:209400_1